MGSPVERPACRWKLGWFQAWFQGKSGPRKPWWFKNPYEMWLNEAPRPRKHPAKSMDDIPPGYSKMSVICGLSWIIETSGKTNYWYIYIYIYKIYSMLQCICMHSVYIHTSIHACMHTYIHTITYNYIQLHYITLHYITLHTYIHMIIYIWLYVYIYISYIII